MNKLLVTGGVGFIGSNFVQYIVDTYPDYEIIVVDSLTYAGDRGRLAAVEDRIQFVQADICNYDKMVELMKDVDIVAHFAAHTHVDRSIADPGPFLQTNVLGTDSVARAAIKQGVKRFHHVSTDEVFGTLEIGSPERFNEKTPYNPRSPYSASKASSDHIVRSYGETYGLPYTITNCSNNYGPWDSPGRVIPVFITNALRDKPLPVYGNGQAIRDYLFVTDHCSAIDLAIHKGELGETYCVGGAAQRNGVQIAETILNILGKPKTLLQYVEDRPGHDMRYDIDPTYIEQKLGWKQSVSFQEGIRQTIDWYKTHTDWWNSFAERFDLQRDSGLYKQKSEAGVREQGQ
ncbi:MAG TPA: dTDP-glucose 4,6-dehydratase [Candidatus Saccharimonadales bacterium]|nr:dTDP-glucose 4,6-dehydratase [Candidatus Saccharimonadales bacterium]